MRKGSTRDQSRDGFREVFDMIVEQGRVGHISPLPYAAYRCWVCCLEVHGGIFILVYKGKWKHELPVRSSVMYETTSRFFRLLLLTVFPPRADDLLGAVSAPRYFNVYIGDCCYVGTRFHAFSLANIFVRKTLA